jgi:3-oxoacyl-[acyl-carrier protein] reductase
MKLSGRVALVTGGGTGMGRAIAETFAREGAKVAVNYSRSQAEAEETVSAICAGGGTAMAIGADVSEDSEVRAMVDQVGRAFGRLDVLVNVRAAVPLLRKQEGSTIVNVSSTAGLTGMGSSMAYAASKAAVSTLTKSLARALAPQIRVNAIAPGLVRTRFASWPAATFDAGEAGTPLKRLPTVDEIARLTLFLVCDATSITGEMMVIDGGLTHLGALQLHAGR